MGTAEWGGVRVAELLQRASVDGKALYASFDGADLGAGQTPDFIVGAGEEMPGCGHDRCADDERQQPLPEIHGAPARLIVPGWDGASWVKWVTRVTVAAEADKGFYFATAYKYPKLPVAPGGAARPEDMGKRLRRCR